VAELRAEVHNLQRELESTGETITIDDDRTLITSANQKQTTRSERVVAAIQKGPSAWFFQRRSGRATAFGLIGLLLAAIIYASYFQYTKVRSSPTEIDSQLELTGADQQQLVKRSTENIEAYNLYLKGRYHERQFTEEGVRTAIGYFKKAIELDPNYALAYSGLADSYVALAAYYVLSPSEALAEARPAAERAVQLDETLAEAHVSLAMVRFCYWDWQDYEKHVRRAKELNPDYAKVYYIHSQYLAAMGRFDEAQAEAKHARQFESPLDISTNVGWILYFARRYDEAILENARAIEVDHALFRPHRVLGLAYLQKHQMEQAIEAIQQSVSLSDGSLEERAYLGYAYARAGRRADALKIENELEVHAERRYVSPYLMALVALGLGNKDQALLRLEQAYEARSVNLIYMNVDPIFDSLRGDPRFNELRQRVGLRSLN
jgi:tetratricopeptide (TPR) repeat protein